MVYFKKVFKKKENPYTLNVCVCVCVCVCVFACRYDKERQDKIAAAAKSL